MKEGYRLYQAHHDDGKWYIDFFDQNEARRKLTAFKSRKDSDEFAKKLMALVSYFSATGGGTPPQLEMWISLLNPTHKKALVRIGLIQGDRTVAGVNVDELVGRWEKYMHESGISDDHRIAAVFRTKALFTQAKVKTLHHIKVPAMVSAIAKLKKDRKLSQRTSNWYLTAARRFCKWCMLEGLLHSNPLAQLQLFEVTEERKRRAITTEEYQKLLDATVKARRGAGLSGRQRALVYLFASETGYRINEIMQLKVGDFIFGEQCSVRLPAIHAKNRSEDTMPIRPSFAALLKEHMQDRPEMAAAFAISSYKRFYERYVEDLELAEVKRLDQLGRILDFHSLRKTFITNLVLAGNSPKVVQALARHSTIKLTMDLYAEMSTNCAKRDGIMIVDTPVDRNLELLGTIVDFSPVVKKTG